MKCRDCGKVFDAEAKRRLCKIGYYNQCTQCARKAGDVERFVGRPGLTNKDSSIEIFRTNLEFVRAQIRRETAIGFGANLCFSNPKGHKFGDND